MESIKMDAQKLLSLFLENKEAGKLECELIADTWQMSYIRIASGIRKHFDSPEHFFLSIIISDRNPSYGYINQNEWIDRVNWKEWCLGLKIEEVNLTELEKDIENALEELKTAEKELDENQRIEFTEIEIPENILQILIIEETKNPKNPVGATWSKLIEATDGYFYMERHWES